MRGLVIRTAVVSALLAAAFGGAQPAGAASSTIAIARQATVSGETVHLRDVAELGGDARELGDVELGRAPSAGESVRMSGESILRRLRQSGLDEGSTVYTIPAWVRVVRAFQEIPDEEIREAVRARLEATLGAGESIEEIALPPAARVPLGSYSIEVEETPGSSGSSRARRAEVRIVQDGGVVRRVAARVAVAAVGPVVVARRPIERGATVDRDDVDVEERALAGLPPNVLSDPAEAIGKEARVAIAPGRPLGGNALVARALVRKGDAVRLQLESAGLRLSASAQALEDGGHGEPVRVLNPTSGREVTGRVVGHGVVAVAQ